MTNITIACRTVEFGIAKPVQSLGYEPDDLDSIPYRNTNLNFVTPLRVALRTSQPHKF
jgi:hypothetical protein